MSKKLFMVITILSAIILGTAIAQQNRRANRQNDAARTTAPDATQTNERNRQRRQGNKGSYKMLKAQSTVPDLKVNAQVAEQFRTNSKLQRLVNLQGNVLKPRKGLKLIKLENGGLALTDKEVEMVPWAETIVVKTDGMIIVYSCKCPGSIEASDDSCKFSNSGAVSTGKNPGTCSGQECCDRTYGWVADDGTWQMYTWD